MVASTDPRGRANEGDLARFWDFSLAMMVVRSYDGYFTVVSPAVERVLGWSAEELMSVPHWEFLHPDDQADTVESTDRELIHGPGSRYDYDVRMLCRDGTYRWTRWNARAVPDEELLYEVGVEISPRTAVEGERTPVATWDADVATDTVVWSAELYAMFDLPPDAPPSYADVMQRTHPDDRPLVDQQYRWALDTGEAYSADFRVVRPDGTIRRLHTVGRITETKGGLPQRMRGITLDVTDRRATQGAGEEPDRLRRS